MNIRTTSFYIHAILIILVTATGCINAHFISNEVIEVNTARSWYKAVFSNSCQVYCYGELLKTVQMAHLYQDSKTFVDMKLRYQPWRVLENFANFTNSTKGGPSKEEVHQFVKENFDKVGTEFEYWSPGDWSEMPNFINNITNEDMRRFGLELNGIWKKLGRKMIADVHKHPEMYSIVPVANPVIVPGGRFIEFYYWDSYWIIRGLLYSGMMKTAEGMLENFLAIVQRIGFIPNGGRVYYSHRSQPPLLAAMIDSFVELTGNWDFGVRALPELEYEFQYWLNNRTVQVKGHNMSIYGDTSTGPRPESYREDILSAKVFASESDKNNYYSELKAAAESGMDFTSRWFINKNGTNVGTLTDLKTRSIVPVELNAIMYWNARIIAKFHDHVQNVDKAREYNAKAEEILKSIEEVHWNGEVGAWLDYDIINQKPREYFVPTNLAPLWVKAFNQSNASQISEHILRYIKKNGLNDFPGGVPNTLTKSGEQWDYPNVWAPMQYILVLGLENLGTPEAKNLSVEWGHRWVQSNFQAYQLNQTMYEKYDATRFGVGGGGGEYEVQTGFGWTNGVIIEFLVKYGKELKPRYSSTAPSKKLMGFVGVATIAMISLVFGRLLW